MLFIYKTTMHKYGKNFKKIESFTEPTLDIKLLMVAGGGSGGTVNSGGGGAGEFMESIIGDIVPEVDYSITVGSGGINDNGSDTLFGDIILKGGGRGGNDKLDNRYGNDGGSGGGVGLSGTPLV